MALASNIREIIDEQARKYGDRIYLIAPEEGLCLTYCQLREEVLQFAGTLLKSGLKQGDKVSFMLGNGYQTVKIFLGTMYAGLVVSPLNLTAQSSQLRYVLEHSDTKGVFYSREHEQKLRECVSKVNRDLIIVTVDMAEKNLFHAGKDLSEYSLPPIHHEDVALLLYTSGTTGQPKGVCLTHKNLMAGAEYTVKAHHLAQRDRALCSLPLYHINGEVVTTLAPLLSGGSVVMPHKFSASKFWQLISDYQCTWFSVVPTILSYLNSSTEIAGKDFKLGQLRFGRSASSSLPTALQKSFEEKFGVPIIETMGLTETTAPIASNPMDTARRKYGSVGLPVGNEIKIMSGDERDLPPGTEGEIMVRGDNVMRGYYKEPALTAKTFTPDGWLRTGDLGYLDEDGFLFVTGRLKELIIKGGENIAPREIDEALYEHQAVLDCASVGMADEHYGQEIMCCVVLKPGCDATEEELKVFCEERLGPFKTPKVIKLMESLPKGPSGKIQRLKLLSSLA